MNLKLVIAAAALAAIPVLAIAQQTGAPPPAAKPLTNAEAQRIVNEIKADKAKVDIFCQFSKLSVEPEPADQKKVDDMHKRASALSQKLGPDFKRLMAAAGDADPKSKEGKEMIAIIVALDEPCQH